MSDALDPLPLLRVLYERGIEYIVVGGFAVNAHGFIRVTKDLDIVPNPAQENLEKLAEMLRDLSATVLDTGDFKSEEIPADPTRTAVRLALVAEISDETTERANGPLRRRLDLSRLQLAIEHIEDRRVLGSALIRAMRRDEPVLDVVFEDAAIRARRGSHVGGLRQRRWGSGAIEPEGMLEAAEEVLKQQLRRGLSLALVVIVAEVEGD